jgi:hypothetical protein
VKITSETVRAALDETLSEVSLSEWDRQRILNAALQPRKKLRLRRPAIRRLCMVGAIFALAVVTATGVLAAVPGLADKLSMLSRQTIDFLKPIEQVDEKSGIRMEVIAAMNDGDTAVIYLSLKDVSGQNRLDDTTSLSGFSVTGLTSSGSDNVTCRPDGTVIVRITGQSDEANLDGKKVTLNLDTLLSRETMQNDVDTGYTVADVLAGNPKPALAGKINPESYSLYGDFDSPLGRLLESGSVQTLKASYHYTDKRVPWMQVLNAGVLDGNLHILTQRDTACWYDTLWLQLADDAGEAYDSGVATVDVSDPVQAGKSPWSKVAAQQEQILALPEGVSKGDMHILYSASTYDTYIDDSWETTFTLQQNTPSITASCTEDVGTWQLEKMTASSIGVTLNGVGEVLETSIDPQVTVTLKDGTKADCSFSMQAVTYDQNGENGQVVSKYLFTEPQQTDQIASVAVNGTVVWQRSDAQAAQSAAGSPAA